MRWSRRKKKRTRGVDDDGGDVVSGGDARRDCHFGEDSPRCESDKRFPAVSIEKEEGGEPRWGRGGGKRVETPVTRERIGEQCVQRRESGVRVSLLTECTECESVTL